MIRVLGAIFAGALVGAFLTHGSQVGIWAGVIIAGAMTIAPLVMGSSALKCPFCRKRVKLGAAVCHHCGRAVGRNANV